MDGSSLHFWFNELWHPLKNGGYQFWSGIGSDVSELTLPAACLMWVKHQNCHVKGCWRKGHADPEHGHPTCRRHQSKLP